MKSRQDWERDARERGIAAASWITDGNTTVQTVRVILAGIESGEPETFDAFAPAAPLSGEWAGESIPELFDIEVGGEWPTDDILDEYEQVFFDAFWHELERICRVTLAGLTD